MSWETIRAVNRVSNKDVLIVCQDFPYPLDYAGPVDSYNKIRALYELGFKISLIATVKNDIKSEDFSEVKKYCHKIFLIRRGYGIKLFFSLLPFQIASRDDQTRIREIAENLSTACIDLIMCDGYYGLRIARNLSKILNIKFLYLRVNNNESKYFLSLARSTPNLVKKIYYSLDSVKFFIHERIFLPKIPITAFLHVSIKEKKYYEKIFPSSKHEFLPAAIDLNRLVTYVKKNNLNVLFVGSLFMPNNIEALSWYLKNVHPSLTARYPHYRLIIAGNSRGKLSVECSLLMESYERIIFHDSPISLDGLYSEACIFINPMLNGAGVKLKSLNAMCYGLPVVSTEVGNEGTGLIEGRDLIVANKSQDFLNGVIDLIENSDLRSRLVRNSQKFINNHYNQALALNRIFKKHSSF